mmetsp:Transcript_38185/g.114176  ORF Transcript_38185/g.114176 Transcript_38185/m.114176 type:complete len:498 (+) Transcript_38185:3362-4855(+)
MGTVRRREKDLRTLLCLHGTNTTMAAGMCVMAMGKKANQVILADSMDLNGDIPLCGEVNGGITGDRNSIKAEAHIATTVAPKRGDRDMDRCRDHEELVVRLKMPADSLVAFSYGARTAYPPKETKMARIAESRVTRMKSPAFVVSGIDEEVDSVNIHRGEPGAHLLLSDLSPSSNDLDNTSMIKPAPPLPFTKREIAILWLGAEDGVSDDVHAGILWGAVEREQRPSPNGSSSGGQPPSPPPSSSRAILELLFLPSRALGLAEGTGPKSASSQLAHFHSDDVALVHVIDVLLSHYAGDSHRINLFASWNGAGEKGLIGKDLGSGPEGPEWWRAHYLEQVMRAKGGVVGGDNSSSNNSGGKMKRGHKIASCLLRWARHMQLHSDSSDALDDDERSGPTLYSSISSSDWDVRSSLDWDHESGKPHHKPGECHQRPPVYVDFVAEVMRMLTARWREGSTALKRRRGRPRGTSGRGRGRPRSVEAEEVGGIPSSSAKKRKR